MSSQRHDGRRPEKDGDDDDRTPPVATRAASRGNRSDASFGVTPTPPGAGPLFAFAPPHPWAPPLRQHVRAPVFARPPDDPSPWSAPVFANPFHDPRLASNVPCPWGPPPSQVPFGGSGSGGAAAPNGGGGGGPGVLFPGSARPVPTDCDADDGGASCLPLARQVGLRAAGAGEPRNFIVSPLSFHAAFALVAAGTRGETQRELLSFLRSGSLDELHRGAAVALVRRLRDRDVAETAAVALVRRRRDAGSATSRASFACGVWVDRNRHLTPEFADAAASRYAAVAESVDFFSEHEQARRRVNAFVSEATKGLIADVLPPGSVDPSTVLVLVNALYFKGTWARPFNPSRTFTAPFHLPGGDTVAAPFMTANLFDEQLIAVFPGFKALKLPYTSRGAHQAAFHMLLLLPDGEALKISDLYDMAVSTPGFIRKHTPVDEVKVGRFMVPKFKFTFKFEASEDMQKLGVTRAFRGGDFSGMVTGGEGLVISGVYHKATIEVDELGTVAAAATAVCVNHCARMARSPPVDFVADRPFLFAIVEERSGVVMFLGHVVNPLLE